MTRAEVDRFRTFGFLVLPGLIDGDTVAALSTEFDRALPDAFGPRFHGRSEKNGITGHYLPAMGPRTLVSRGLVERLLAVGEALLGAPALPWYAQEILFFDQAALHDDYGIPATGVKLVAYLEPLHARNGALRLVPGSHHPDLSASLRDCLRRHPVEDSEELRRQVDETPCFVAETSPGDVIAFDLHTFHASIYGRDRCQWTVTYFKDPGTDAERRAFAEVVADGARWAGERAAYDRGAYPYFPPEWVAGESEAAYVARLRELGVFEVLR